MPSIQQASPATGNGILIEARDVSIRFATDDGTVTAVEGISFPVRRGEKFVLLGPSGCGKSTLLKAVAGFVRPSHGAILYKGVEAGEPGAERIVVFQEFDQLLPWKTVLGNVMFGLRAAGRAAEDMRGVAESYIRLVGLEGFAQAYPHTLSGGMKQRVALARALAVDPDVLLMDEPFGALDALTRLRMQQELNRIWRETHKTILFVTHSIQEALVIGHRIMVMTSRPGRVKEIVDNPLAETPREGPEVLQIQRHIQDLLGVGEDNGHLGD